MVVAQGRHYHAIPGPSVMPDRVLAAMQRAAPNIYEGEIIDVAAKVQANLKIVAGTTHYLAMYIGNGHATWEAANANLFSRGDKALVLATGHFGFGWAASAQAMGIDVTLLDFGKTAAVDLARFESALRADHAHEIKVVLVTHVDTATTVRNDIAALRQVLDLVRHPALLAVDAIASMGCDPYLMDAWGVDVTVAASQKGLMTPPGMGFVWFSPKALALSASSDLRSPYWNWQPRAFGAEFWQLWAGTAPTHHIYGLEAALDLILAEGLPAVWARHKALAASVWAAFDAWALGHEHIAMNVPDPAHRGTSVTAARFGAPHAMNLRIWCEKNAGVTLGIGLGMTDPNDPAYHGFLRVAHMGHVNAHMTLGALSVIEAGLSALDIPHGHGALTAAAHSIARAVGP